MAHVLVFQSNHSRARVLCNAMVHGIKRCNLDKVDHVLDADYRGDPVADIALFYGASGKLKQIMHDYIAAGKKALYMDLGYWGRHAGGRRQGFHKIVVNSRHPTSYYRTYKHSPDRWRKFQIPVKPWQNRSDGVILIAGISAKGARFEGFEPLEWERNAIKRIRASTDRPIIYRPKPTCPNACPIVGVGYSPPSERLDAVMAKTAIVVSHHSNTNIEAILSGICSLTDEGVAVDQSQTDFSKIEKLVQRDDRAQWAADIAYCQWNVAEMALGSPWAHLKNEGLIP